MSGAHLDAAAVQRALSGRELIGQGDAAVEVHTAVDSTMARALALAEGGAAEGTLVVAGSQEAGRGRRGRAWVSPPGGLYLSLLLRPDEAMLRRLPVTLLGGLAVAEALERLGAAPSLKWPNDVLLGEKKVAGVLGELTRGPDGAVLVLGVGVNVETPLTALPPSLADTATSLAAWSSAHGAGAAPALEAVLAAFAERFEAHYLAVRRGGGASILSSASARMPMLGKTVRLRLLDEAVEGTASGLNATGGLVLELPDGARKVFVAGEVEEVRPA